MSGNLPPGCTVRDIDEAYERTHGPPEPELAVCDGCGYEYDAADLDDDGMCQDCLEATDGEHVPEHVLRYHHGIVMGGS